MILLRFVLTITFFLAFISSSLSDELKELMLKQLNSKNFDTISDTYKENYNSMALTDGEIFFQNKKEIKEFHKTDFAKNAEKKVFSFNITSRSETKDFVTVIYNYEYEVKIFDQNINRTVEGVGVYLKTDNGYVSIFDAASQ